MKKNIDNYNSGSYNSGHRNSGDCNSGNRNSGDYNSGSYNSGDHNSGDWNKTNFSSGCFNTIEPKIYLFNKPSEWTHSDWNKSTAKRLLGIMPTEFLGYILLKEMTDEEKIEHPEAEITGGYLKLVKNSDQAVTWWRALSTQEKNIITSIPNFDKDIFKEITGIDVDENNLKEELVN